MIGMNMLSPLKLLLLGVCWPAMLSAQTLLDTTFLQQLDLSTVQADYNPSAQYGLVLYRVRYITPDVAGLPDTASGLLCVPLADTTPVSLAQFPLLCYQHGTVLSKVDVPSRLEGGSFAAIGLASYGFITCAADYLGLGDSRGFHPYLHAATEASASLDMLYAVRRLLLASFPQQTDTCLNLFVAGYSQGGHAALAVQQVLETDTMAQRAFHLKASAPMAGPYDLSGTMRAFAIENPAYPVKGFGVGLIAGYQRAYGTIYDQVSDVFKPAYVPAVEQFLQDSINDAFTLEVNLFLSGAGGLAFQEILADSFWQAFSQDSLHPLRVALRENDLYRWAPITPTRLLYCPDDDIVAGANSVLADSVMNALGATDLMAVNVDTMGQGLDHSACGTPAVQGAYAFFQSVGLDSLFRPCPGDSMADSTVSLISVAELPISVYPMPFDEQLQLVMPTEIGALRSVTVRDLQGKLIWRNDRPGQPDRIQITTTTWPTGVYLLQVRTTEQRYARLIQCSR